MVIIRVITPPLGDRHPTTKSMLACNYCDYHFCRGEFPVFNGGSVRLFQRISPLTVFWCWLPLSMKSREVEVSITSYCTVHPGRFRSSQRIQWPNLLHSIARQRGFWLLGRRGLSIDYLVSWLSSQCILRQEPHFQFGYLNCSSEIWRNSLLTYGLLRSLSIARDLQIS